MAVLDKNKLLGKKENGGALAVRPKANLVPSKSLGSDIVKVEPVQESPTLVIKTKLIKIEDLLKGTLALEKKQAEDKRKELEEEKRKKQEDQIEGAPKKDKKFKMPVPKKVTSFFDDIKRYIGTVLMGWLVVRLVKFLPKILPILKLLGNVADFLIEWGGKLLDGLVTVVDKGYEAFEKTSEWIGDVFGEDKQKEFEKFAGVFTKFLNVALVAAMVGAKAGMLGMGGGGPRRGIVNQGKRLLKKGKRFFDPKRAEKLKRLKKIKEIAKKRKAAEAALRRARMLRKLRPTNLRRVARVVTGKPLRAVSNVIKSPAAQNVVKTTQDLIKNPGQTVKNLRQAGADKLDDVAKNVGKSKWFNNLKGAGKNLWAKGVQAKNFLGKQGRNFLNWADNFGKKFMANADEIIKGVSARASNWAKTVGDIAEMARNPMKLVEKVKSVLGGQLDDVVKQNKTVAKLVNLAKNPKEITKGIKGLLSNAKKSKGLLQLRQGLKGAQKMKIGGIDKVIAAIMGLLDYTVFKESPINAILRAIGGLLGYTAGFAIGAPFGGAPGFITGMAGGFVGEKVAMLIAKGLAKTKLGKIQDPIMNDGRMLVRDPDNEKMNEELEGAQLEHGLGDDEKYNEIEKLRTEKKLSARFDVETGKAYINDQEVAMDEYEKFVNLSQKEQLLQYGIPQGNANNIVATNGVSNKVNGVSSSASYEDDVEVIDGQEAYDKGYRDGSTGVEKASSTEQKVIPVVMGESGGTDAVSEQLYAGG